MSSSGILILSNIKKIQNTLKAIKKLVKNVYIHLNVPKTNTTSINPSAFSTLISKIYQDSLSLSSDLDVRVLVSPLKVQSFSGKEFDYIFADENLPEACEEIRSKYCIQKPTIYLNNTSDYDLTLKQTSATTEECYNTVVLGGTFDRIHTGHKILLTEGVLRACKRLVVGVTDENMISSKILHELILPVEKRIEDVRSFLNDIDSTLEYDVVPIQDPFGPTKVDPNMDMIIVSAETLRGGHKVNEVRVENGLKPLKIHCISMIESDTHCQYKETKISSSNQRMDLLGTRINPKQPRPNLPRRPYIIGLCGGIASGKSKIIERLQNLGAFVIDCDKLAHEIYEPGKKCYKKIIEYFGKDIIQEHDKKINRQKLGSIVFNNTKLLDKLNEIVWPELLIETKKRIYDEYEKRKYDVAIIEAAVLLKAGWEIECHEVWSTIISPKEAIKRLKERNNLPEEEACKRLNAQLSNKEIVQKSNVIFSPEWSYEFTQEQIERAWKMLMNELNNKDEEKC